MKNKLIIALLIASMAVSVTACGKSDKDTTEAVEQTSDAKRSGEYESSILTRSMRLQMRHQMNTLLMRFCSLEEMRIKRTKTEM